MLMPDHVTALPDHLFSIGAGNMLAAIAFEDYGKFLAAGLVTLGTSMALEIFKRAYKPDTAALDEATQLKEKVAKLEGEIETLLQFHRDERRRDDETK